MSEYIFCAECGEPFQRQKNGGALTQKHVRLCISSNCSMFSLGKYITIPVVERSSYWNIVKPDKYVKDGDIYTINTSELLGAVFNYNQIYDYL